MCGCIWFILVLVFLLQLMQILGSRFTTQSLLLLEKQSGQTLEMTAEDCVWQTKTENGWRKVQPELLLQGAASVDAWQKQQKQCFTHADMGALTCCFDAQKYLFEVFFKSFFCWACLDMSNGKNKQHWTHNMYHSCHITATSSSPCPGRPRS